MAVTKPEPVPATIAPVVPDVHPLDDPAVIAEIKEWTIMLLKRTGSAKIVIEIDFHAWRSKGVRLGGMAGRKH